MKAKITLIVVLFFPSMVLAKQICGQREHGFRFDAEDMNAFFDEANLPGEAVVDIYKDGQPLFDETGNAVKGTIKYANPSTNLNEAGYRIVRTTITMANVPRQIEIRKKEMDGSFLVVLEKIALNCPVEMQSQTSIPEVMTFAEPQPKDFLNQEFSPGGLW